MDRQFTLVLITIMRMILCIFCAYGAYINFQSAHIGAAILCTVAAVLNFIAGIINLFWG